MAVARTVNGELLGTVAASALMSVDQTLSSSTDASGGSGPKKPIAVTAANVDTVIIPSRSGNVRIQTQVRDGEEG